MPVTAAAAVLTAPTAAGATQTERGPLMYLAIVRAMTLVSGMILRDTASTRVIRTRTVTPRVESHAVAAAVIFGKKIGLRKKMVLEKVAVSGMNAGIMALAGIETIIAVVITAILLNRAIVGGVVERPVVDRRVHAEIQHDLDIKRRRTSVIRTFVCSRSSW